MEVGRQASRKVDTQLLLPHEMLKARKVKGKAGSGSQARGTGSAMAHMQVSRISKPCSHSAQPLPQLSSLLSLLACARQAQPAVR